MAGATKPAETTLSEASATMAVFLSDIMMNLLICRDDPGLRRRIVRSG